MLAAAAGPVAAADGPAGDRNRRHSVVAQTFFIPSTGDGDHSVRRTTRPRRWRWLAAAVIRARARFRSRITACCFLDELPEFNRHVLEECCANRWSPGHITISRAAHQAEFPARFQVAAMNPARAVIWATAPDAAAARRKRCGSTGRACPARCSTALTCTWTCRRYRAISCWNKHRRPAKRPRRVRARGGSRQKQHRACASPTANSNRARWMSFVR